MPYSYFPNGQLKLDPEGTYTYDARGLVATRVVASGTYTFQYDQLGRNNILTYPDGHQRVQQYDSEGRIISRCYNYTGGPASRCYGATYDPVGNPVQMTDPEGTDTISYDGLDRVAQVSRSTGWMETYAYNALGALKVNAGVTLDDQRQVLGGPSGQTADAAIPNTFNAQPVTIDAEGKITSLSATPLTYDFHGAVQTVAGSGQILYDGFMRAVTSQGTQRSTRTTGTTGAASGNCRAARGM